MCSSVFCVISQIVLEDKQVRHSEVQGPKKAAKDTYGNHLKRTDMETLTTA